MVIRIRIDAMTRSRLLILFGIATLVCMTAFTAVVYHGHVKASNQQDLNYLRLYVEQVNEKRQQGISSDRIPLPHHVINDNTYQIFVIDKNGKMQHWLTPRPWFTRIIRHFPFSDKRQQTQGHFSAGGEDIHWIKLPLSHPPASIYFIHLDSDHWRSFSRTFGAPFIIFGIFIFSSAVWSAIILSRLFKRVQGKNELLQSQAVEICLARDEAYAAAQAKSRFLANISHELRTPLTAILGFSENMLDSGEIGASQQVPLQTIIRNGNHLLHIINDLLDLSKIEADKMQIEKIEFSPVQLLQDIELLMHQQAEDKGLEFRVNYAWPFPACIKNDPFRFKQVLINLSSNAIKFTGQGHVHINVSCRRDEQTICLEVVDTGIGIARQQHEKIFQAFAQADVSTTRQYGGSGLGLSLSRRLAELMGGSLELASEPGKGSRFTLRIPTGSLAETEFITDLSTHKLPAPTTDKPGYTLLRGRILVADDAPDNRLLLAALPGKFGLHATLVENGQQALDALADKEFDLVVLDIQMPVLDGIQTCRTLREQNCDIPVLALTANTLADDRRICRAAGFTDFIAKPIRIHVLHRLLSRYLAEAQAPVIESARPAADDRSSRQGGRQ